jgi:hypothetical protein
VVTKVNKRLFFDEDPPSPTERKVLLRRWYRLNAVRIALVGTAWVAAERARDSAA